MATPIRTIHRLSFSLGGYSCTNYEVELVDDELRYRKWDYHPGGVPSVRSISPEERLQLIEGLNSSELPNWTFAEMEVMVMDGTQWELLIQYNGSLKKRFYGSNQYPNPTPGQDQLKYTPAFRKFIDTINRLVPEFKMAK